MYEALRIALLDLALAWYCEITSFRPHFNFPTVFISMFHISYRSPCHRLQNQWGSPHEHWNRIHWIRIPVRIQRGLVWAPNTTKTAHIALLDWISRTVRRSIAHSSDPDRGRVELKCSFDADPRSASDPDRSKVPCGEPQCIIFYLVAMVTIQTIG